MKGSLHSHFRAERPRQTPHMKQESSAGLLDSGNRPVYANAEAIRVFVYPENPAETKSAGSYLAERIQTLALNGQDRTQLPAARDFISGRRRYLCRFFVLESDWKKGAVLTLAVLIERAGQTSSLVTSVARQFHLTCREKETVRLLFEGLIIMSAGYAAVFLSQHFTARPNPRGIEHKIPAGQLS
jgi:hypothetical protein